jgi:hypothetical protein
MVSNQGELTGFQRGEKRPEKEEKGEEKSEPKNQGKLIVDATCAPADIRYPNDLGILNQAREQTEEIIGSLYEPIKDKFLKKPALRYLVWFDRGGINRLNPYLARDLID